MSEKARAWILPVSATQQVAIAEYQMYEYLTEAKTAEVPLAPAYSSQLLFWQDRQVPMIDLSVLLENKTPEKNHGYVIVAYQAAAKAPIQYAGLSIIAPPIRISVHDSSASGLPEEFSGHLRDIILSCFSHEDDIVPVIDVSCLCSKEFRMQTLNH